MLAVALSGAGVARAAEPASVVVLFDGSGSMWGNIEGSKVAKFALARDGLRRGLAKVRPETRVGLAGFGHRRGDCSDVEMMAEPEPLTDAARITDPLETYNPRGRGPLTLALRTAARSLPPASVKRTLVLIHDDADNCQQDVCAAAVELKAAGIVAHVVGIALKPNDLPKMACLPQLTGGRLFNAQTGDQLAPAIEEAMALASHDGGTLSLAPSPEPRRAPVAGPGPVPPDAPAGLYLRAQLARDGEPVGWPVNWAVITEGRADPPIFEARAANPYVAVPPGRYLVEARDGSVAVRQVFEVDDRKPTTAALVLNAGTLQIRAQVQRTGAPLADAIIAIIEAGQGGDIKKEAATPLALFKGSEGTATLPAGRYLVRVEQGAVRIDRPVVVPVGSQGRIEVPLNGARLQLTLAGREGTSLIDSPVFSVAEDDPYAPSGKREVARSAARLAEFVLPPGTYHILARQGGVEARERLALGPGDFVRRTVALSPARLALSSRLAGTGQPLNEAVSYRIERLDGAPGEPAITTSRPAPTLLLAGGRYRVEGRYGSQNARTVREIELRAGQPQQLVLEHQAVGLKLRLAGVGGAALTEVFWDIRDEAGTTVWTTGQPEPSAMLQAGRYTVRAESRDKRTEQTVELRAGDPRTLNLAAD